MAYINATEVKAIRNELKKEFPNYRFGVRKGSGSHNVHVTVKKGPAFEVFEKYGRYDEGMVTVDLNKDGNVNHYWLEETTGPNAPFFEKIVEIIKTAPYKAGVGDMWFDDSDIMTDYFHTAYYFDISVGEWNKPYEITA
jgi:hypothetical protein